ncbi:hypothetical protein, partial [Salmonella sp. s51884]|uniref:hypothetical protein n=1 Tax=Salmonella sp. s51884 TaxID=3159654 RepID=UPI00398064C1
MTDLGVSFSILMNHTFSLSAKKERRNEIFGFDNIGVFTEKLAGSDVDLVKGDRGLLQYINQPGNPCTDLAIVTGGAVFSTNAMMTKDFKDVFA